MGKMKEIALEQMERQMHIRNYDSNGIGYLLEVNNPTSVMEIQYEESLRKLMGNYHRLTNEEIIRINILANRL